MVLDIPSELAILYGVKALGIILPGNYPSLTVILEYMLSLVCLMYQYLSMSAHEPPMR